MSAPFIRSARWSASVVLGAIITAIGLTAGTMATAAQTHAHTASGRSATYALPSTWTPTYIFPLMPVQDLTPANGFFFQQLMFRPLYLFGSGGGFRTTRNAAALNPDESVAYPPVYSDGGKTVTIRLRNYRWSDGAPVTARDIEFWQNLVTANKQDWFSYVPGAYPDNVVSTKIINIKTIQFVLNHAYQPVWFTYNELSQITPLPQHAWDKTCATCKVGNYDMTKSGAVAVYNFLAAQAKDEAAYATNPLWKVTDGPWRLTGFTPTTGRATYAFNTGYSGPVAKHHITTFVADTFTTDAAELNVLRSGGLTFGYVPATEASLHSTLSGYMFAPWNVMVIEFTNVNQNNPTNGAIVRQSYIRQVMEELTDQKGILKAYWGGYGVPTCGPVPTEVPNPWVSPYEKRCPYHYNPSRAIRTLKSHGWTVVPGGVSYCSHPSKCGPGIVNGAKLDFNYLYEAGNAAFQGMVESEKSEAAQAGIRYNLQPAPFGTIIADSVPCGPGSLAPKANCNWQLSSWGGWGYSPDFYPTGELLFKTDAGVNYDNFSNPSVDKAIEASYLPGNALKTMYAYENLIVDELPVIWQPNYDYQLSEVAKNLKGALPQNGEGWIFPEEWHYSR